jgi:hypothetical protein
VVMKRGTATVAPQELRRAVEGGRDVTRASRHG